MTRTILACLIVFSLSTNVLAQGDPLPPETTTKFVITDFFQALAALDAEKARSLCTPDVMILESGKVWNFDSLALRITTRKAKSADFKRVNQLDFIDTKFTADAAWVSYFNKADISFSGKTTQVQWLETVVLRKEKAGWKIALLHSTELDRKLE